MLSSNVQAQHQCGNGIRNEKLRTDQPDVFREMLSRHQQHTEAALAGARSGAAQKTTAQYPIPVVFHFLLTQVQWNQIGNDTGIIRRVHSQLASLNNDFNRRNADSTLIPAAFKSAYTNVNIQFGLANGTNSTTIGPGIELKIIPSSSPAYDPNVDCFTAKEATAVGLPAWDVSKYLNIWVVNITSGVIGITTPYYMVGQVVGPPAHTIGANEIGGVVTYGAFGVREFPSQYFLGGIDKGRTLTHELGHFFDLWHIWGDDGGGCPATGGQDDFIPDTPPQGDANYCSSGTCPNFPKTDACSPSSPGVMFMNYMDYVDDRAMQMFTNDQGSVMRTILAQEYPTLTQNPQLLLGIARVSENAFQVFPNPATDEIRITITGKEKLLGIDVVNMLGQSISHTEANNSKSYRIPLADAARGIYFVHCRFAEGVLTKKIVLE